MIEFREDKNVLAECSHKSLPNWKMRLKNMSDCSKCEELFHLDLHTILRYVFSERQPNIEINLSLKSDILNVVSQSAKRGFS